MWNLVYKGMDSPNQECVQSTLSQEWRVVTKLISTKETSQWNSFSPLIIVTTNFFKGGGSRILRSSCFIRREWISISMANVGSHWERKSVSCAGFNPPLQPGMLKGKTGGRDTERCQSTSGSFLDVYSWHHCASSVPFSLDCTGDSKSAWALSWTESKLAEYKDCQRNRLLDSLPGGNSNNA